MHRPSSNGARTWGKKQSSSEGFLPLLLLFVILSRGKDKFWNYGQTGWRKRSIPTHSERFKPPTFESKNGLKNGAYPFNIAENAENRSKKRSIAVHLLREWCLEYRNRTKNGAGKIGGETTTEITIGGCSPCLQPPICFRLCSQRINPCRHDRRLRPPPAPDRCSRSLHP